MRFAKIIIGVILLIKGTKSVIDLPSAISTVQAVAGAPGFSAGYATGEIVGLVISALAVLIGGAILFTNGLASFRDRNRTAPAA